MKLLRGKRILIEKPEVPESQFTLTEKIEKDIERDLIKSWSKLKVFSVGDQVTDIKAGDLVYVGTALQHAEVIDIDDKLYFMVNEAAVSIIW